MHYPAPHLDPRLRAMLEAELREACIDPALKALVAVGGAALLPRFARYHDYLSHLPRRLRRALQRQWKRSLSALALLLALGQAPALAASIDVTTNLPDINADGNCSLIEAIDNANDTATGSVHTDCTTGAPAGGDTINLPRNSTHTLTADYYSTYDDRGLPLITSAITIEGHGSTITRDDDSPNFRIFAVNSSGDLTLNETTVSGGQVVDSPGGGVLNAGTATLTNSTVSGNGAEEDGGGVVNFGTLALTNSTVSGNGANFGGGGVDNSGTLTLTHSTVSGNSSGTLVGGVLNSGTLTLSRSLVSGNSGPNGEVLSDYYSVVTADDFNLFGSGGYSGVYAFTPGATDIVPVES
ncbi:MAG: hypothetical protein ACREU8_09205, partial [Gammaproteobacteria bacterium]